MLRGRILMALAIALTTLPTLQGYAAASHATPPGHAPWRLQESAQVEAPPRTPVSWRSDGFTVERAMTVTVGLYPQLLPRTPVWGQVVVPDNGDGTVATFPAARPPRRAEQLPYTFGAPFDAAGDELRGLTFVSDPLSNTISVLDRRGVRLTTITTATIPALNGAGGLAVDPLRGQVVESNFNDNAVNVLTEGGQPLATISTTALLTPTDVAIDPLRGRAYISGEGSNTIGVLDEATHRLRTFAGCGLQGPVGIAVNVVSGRVYAVDPSANRVSVFDASGACRAIIGGPAFDYPFIVRADVWHNVLYVANNGATGSGSSLTLIDGDTNTVMGVIERPDLFDGPEGISIAPTRSGAIVCVSNDNLNTVTVLQVRYRRREVSSIKDSATGAN